MKIWWDPKIPIAGVGIIAVYPDERTGQDLVLMLTERVSKQRPKKLAGQRSIPMETRLQDEPLNHAMQRLVNEEMGGLEDVIEIDPEPVGLYQIDTGVWLLVSHGKCSTAQLPEATRCDREVGDHRWEPVLSVLSQANLRTGVREALSDFQKGKRQVRRALCTPSEKPCL